MAYGPQELKKPTSGLRVAGAHTKLQNYQIIKLSSYRRVSVPPRFPQGPERQGAPRKEGNRHPTIT